MIVAFLVCLLIAAAITIPLVILSTQKPTIDSKVQAKLLVTGGFHDQDGGLSWPTEIIDLANNSTCTDWAKLPTQFQAAVGGFLGNGMLFCGGVMPNNSYTDKCYLITSDLAIETTKSPEKSLISIL